LLDLVVLSARAVATDVVSLELAAPGAAVLPQSAELHRIATAGAAIRASAPGNAFTLEPASHYLFLAGGIGVTPLLAMAREVSRRGRPWTFVYGGRMMICVSRALTPRLVLDL
jgi:hypothetical protein